MDLALTVTYFPECGLAFAILFGCSFSREKEIIKLLSHVGEEAAHPLLMPGIFAELENSRHIKLVQSTINEVEGQTFELDFLADGHKCHKATTAAERIKKKRTSWLNLTYLRNSMETWNNQLAKMVQHSEFLIQNEFRPNILANRMSSSTTKVANAKLQELDKVDLEGSCSSGYTLNDSLADTWEFPGQIDTDGEEKGNREGVVSTNRFLERERQEFCKKMCDSGHRIQERILSIRDDYDEKIRDCTTRLDGMAMATQWSHGETNVEIALATSRDSRHMRSIALVTMVFLPGTFFAVSVNASGLIINTLKQGRACSQ